ncbi:hypothetical protein T12_13069, partial [Trichinella patagoniensis]
MSLESETSPGMTCFISFPVIPTKITTARNFLTIFHQISIYKSCDQNFLFGSVSLIARNNAILDEKFLYYKNESQVQMSLESETFPG